MLFTVCGRFSADLMLAEFFSKYMFCSIALQNGYGNNGVRVGANHLPFILSKAQ